ncbi:hypothetical protein [Cellulomonas bogoriensis]|nr:hypothetical protein [Cellulomonas bogoriensis]
MTRLTTTARPRRSARTVASLTFVAALALAGCGGEDAAEPDTNDTDADADVAQETDDQPAEASGWESAVAEAMERAREDGADDEQLEILERGEVTFEEYEAAVGRTIACLREEGIEVVDDEVVDLRGFPEIYYSYADATDGRSDEETDEISQACLRRHSLHVESLYRTSPQAEAAQDEQFAPRRDAVLECLRDNGVTIEGDVSRQELESISAGSMSETGVNCLEEAEAGD